MITSVVYLEFDVSPDNVVLSLIVSSPFLERFLTEFLLNIRHDLPDVASDFAATGATEGFSGIPELPQCEKPRFGALTGASRQVWPFA